MTVIICLWTWTSLVYYRNLVMLVLLCMLHVLQNPLKVQNNAKIVVWPNDPQQQSCVAGHHPHDPIKSWQVCTGEKKKRHFQLLLWNCWLQFNETWQEARAQRPLPSLSFWVDWKNKMVALASDWLRHFRLLLWDCWPEFNKTWLEARSQRPLQSLCFAGPSEKQDGHPDLWLAETFSTSPLKLQNWIQQNLTGSKITMSSTKVVFFWLIGKIIWLSWPLIGWDIFDFSSETAELNSTNLDRKQDLNVLYQVCVYLVDRKNKMAALASNWLRHFRLLLWNCCPEFNQNGRLGLWLAEIFLTSPLKLLNRIQRNLTESKISTFSTKFVFFKPMS